MGVGQEPGQGVAQGGERRGGRQPGLQAGGGRAKAAQLEVVEAEAGGLHFLLAAPLGPSILEPDLQNKQTQKVNRQVEAFNSCWSTLLYNLQYSTVTLYFKNPLFSTLITSYNTQNPTIYSP